MKQLFQFSLILLLFTMLSSCSTLGPGTTYGDNHALNKYERNGFSQTSDSCSFKVKNKTYVDQFFTVDQQTFTIPAATKKWIFKKKGKVKFKVAIGNHIVRDNIRDQAQLEVIPTLAYSHMYHGNASPVALTNRPWMNFFPDESHPAAPHNLKSK